MPSSQPGVDCDARSSRGLVHEIQNGSQIRERQEAAWMVRQRLLKMTQDRLIHVRARGDNDIPDPVTRGDALFRARFLPAGGPGERRAVLRDEAPTALSVTCICNLK